MSLVFDDRNVTSFHLPISLFEILRSLTSSILILEIIFNVQFSRYHITCFASYCEKSLRDSRRFHRNALLSSFESKQFYLDSVETERFELSTNGLKVRCSTDWANDPITERFVLLINSTATILLKIYDLASIFLQKFHIFSRTWFLSGSYSTISFEILKTLPSLLIVNVRYSKIYETNCLFAYRTIW